MDAPAGGGGGSSIGGLFGRVAGEGRKFVEAGGGLYKAVALRRASLARNGAIALVAAVFLVNAALVALLVGLAMQLAIWVGPALGGLIVFLAIAGIGLALVRFGAGKLAALGGDAD